MNQLKYGTKVELEHAKTIKKYMKKGVNVKDVAKSIAKDHLKERKDYYKVVKKLKL
jgi:hypothetical protein